MVYTASVTPSNYAQSITNAVFDAYFVDSSMIVGEDQCTFDDSTQEVNLNNPALAPDGSFPTVTASLTATQYRLSL